MAIPPTDPKVFHDEYEEADAHFSVLADRYRRLVLRFFHVSETDVTTIDDLVEFAMEQEGVEIDRERLTIQFHHATLPALAATVMIEYDARSTTVKNRNSRLVEQVLNWAPEVEASS